MDLKRLRKRYTGTPLGITDAGHKKTLYQVNDRVHIKLGLKLFFRWH